MNLMKRLIILLILILILRPAIYGQEFKVTASFDTSKIYIGDQIDFTISIDQPAEIVATLPLLRDTLTKNIEILAGPVIDTASNQDGRITIIEKYLITSFDSGYYQVPPVYAEVKDEGGLKRFYSDYSQLEVMRVRIAPADTTAKIYDIIDPYRAPLTIGEIFPWLLLAALSGALIWAAIRYLPRLKKDKPGVVTIINPDPAHVIALHALEKLREEQLWQKGEVKSYYTKLTEILRQYLENRYSVFSLELTTYETLEALLKTGFKKDKSYNKLKSVLCGADLVKFAKYNPDAVENDLHFQDSWDFVLTTKEREKIIEPIDENDKTGEEGK